MFLFLSKFLPLFVYPLGLACVLLVVALIVRRRARWQNTLVIFAFLLLYLGGNRFVTMALTGSLERQYPALRETPSVDVIVVLGGASRSQLAPRVIPEVEEAGDRLIYAAWLYRQGAAANLLVTGGKPFLKAGESSEADEMAFLLELMGVPNRAVWRETRSNNTYENAVESKLLLEEKGINRIILVTSAYHMPRAVAIFRKQGFEVIPAPTDFLVTDADWDHYTQPDWELQLYNLLPGADDLQLTSRILKEYIGIGVYWMRGWL